MMTTWAAGGRARRAIDDPERSLQHGGQLELMSHTARLHSGELCGHVARGRRLPCRSIDSHFACDRYRGSHITYTVAGFVSFSLGERIRGRLRFYSFLPAAAVARPSVGVVWGYHIGEQADS